MIKFVDAMKRGDSDKRVDEVLQAGKRDMKRHFPVDEKYYGTEEGVAVKELVVEELKKKQERPKSKKKVAAEKSPTTPTQPTMLNESNAPQREGADAGMSATTASAIALATVGTAAVAASILLGGGRSR